MNTRNNQSGFTLIELLFVIFGCFVVGLGGFAIYAAIHFLMKFW